MNNIKKIHIIGIVICLVSASLLTFSGCDAVSDSSLIGELLQGNLLGNVLGEQDSALPDDFQVNDIMPGGSFDEHYSQEPDVFYPETAYPSDCTEHEFDEWTLSEQYNCIQDGQQYRTCRLCGEREFEIIPATGHEYIDMVCQICHREYYSSGLQYQKDANGYIVTGIGTCTDLEINVPETYNGEVVHTIGADAFSANPELLIVGLHDGITTIERDAFRDCYSLQTLYIPTTVTYIDPSALFLCTNLKDIAVKEANPRYAIINGCLIDKESNTLMHVVPGFSIPDDGSVLKIGTNAFAGRSDITHLTIPEGVTVIEAHAFYCVGSLQSITLPSTLQSIGYNCFNANGLKEVTIPEGITQIEDNTFNYCSDLTTVYIPASVESIGIYAFHNCRSLDRIIFGGTEEQWRNMIRTPDWDLEAGNYTVEFTEE